MTTKKEPTPAEQIQTILTRTTAGGVLQTYREDHSLTPKQVVAAVNKLEEWDPKKADPRKLNLEPPLTEDKLQEIELGLTAFPDHLAPAFAKTFFPPPKPGETEPEVVGESRRICAANLISAAAAERNAELKVNIEKGIVRKVLRDLWALGPTLGATYLAGPPKPKKAANQDAPQQDPPPLPA